MPYISNDPAMPSLKGPAPLIPRILPVALSFLLLWAFFQPWAVGLGGVVSAPRLQEKLETPRRIASFLSHKNGRVAKDHRLAGYVWFLAAAEGAGLAAALWPPLTVWPVLISGLSATVTAHWAGAAIERYPMQHPGRGVTVTFWGGLGLFGVSLMRLLTRKKIAE